MNTRIKDKILQGEGIITKDKIVLENPCTPYNSGLITLDNCIPK